jgi:hypothetical protein
VGAGDDEFADEFGRHDESVAGGHEREARGELGPFGVLAGQLLLEDFPAARRLERVELALQPLPAGGHPGVADPDLGQEGPGRGRAVRWAPAVPSRVTILGKSEAGQG